uniref:Uncharacterized protein n=1 Tax=Anguilla anguilla TaxID=7936 RepID=A0A0E9RPE7_ANGAN
MNVQHRELKDGLNEGSLHCKDQPWRVSSFYLLQAVESQNEHQQNVR